MTEANNPESPSKNSAPIDPELARKIARLRSALRENFGQAVLALMNVPRYNTQTLADLQHLVLDPMLNDRVAFAYAGRSTKGNEGTVMPDEDRDTAGFAIWASVSEEVDGRIRQQISQGVFPIRLKPNDWNSGKINWLFDVITPNQKTAAAVIGNFRQVAKEGELRLHPVITRLIDPELLEKMGARRSPEGATNGEASPAVKPQKSAKESKAAKS